MPERLFEAIVDANHRAIAGDNNAGLHPAEFADELPLIALTCVDPRLNALLPQALGVAPEQFIWLRNAGNIITGPLSSTMRSLALACAVKGGKEIVVIGHTDCQVSKTTALQLLDRFRALGVERHILPDNLNEFFGIFASERQNVIKAVDFIHNSPIIGPKVPVHGLLIDIETGKLEWLVNGYETLGSGVPRGTQITQPAAGTVAGMLDALKPLAAFNFGEMKFPEGKIGEVASTVAEELAKRIHAAAQSESTQHSSGTGTLRVPVGFKMEHLEIPTSKIGEAVVSVGEEIAQRLARKHGIPLPQQKPAKPVEAPPKIPMPPPIRPKVLLRRAPK
jgi:carbonic anhydrase